MPFRLLVRKSRSGLTDSWRLNFRSGLPVAGAMPQLNHPPLSRMHVSPSNACSPLLCGRQNRLSDGLGQRDRAEQRLRIQVVVAGFIDDPDEAVLPGIGVAKGDVDFSSLQRCRIA